MRARIAPCVFLLSLCLCAVAAAMRMPSKPTPDLNAPTRVMARREMLNTTVDIIVYAADPEAAKTAINAAFDEIAALEKQLSRYLPESDVSRVNAHAADGPVTVSEPTFAMLQTSLKFSALSDGAFDATVTPYITLWRDAAKQGILPSDADLATAGEQVGWTWVELDAEKRTVRFKRKGMAIDLGGVAKGYAVDRAAAVLKKAGLTDGIVNAGGDLIVFGSKPGGDKWTVGIQDPRHPESSRELIMALDVTDCAVATSGNYQRFSIVGGRRISHILDPRTGQPADAVPSVTIMAHDVTTADALATAVSVLGVERGLALIERLKGVEGLLVTVGDGKLKLHATEGFPKARQSMQREIRFQISR